MNAQQDNTSVVGLGLGYVQGGLGATLNYDYYTSQYGYVQGEILFSFSEDTVTDFELKVFPNPATNYITIETNQTDEMMQIFNVNGQLVKALNFNASTTKQFDVSSLAAGTYFIKMGQTVKRIIIQ